MKHLRLIGFIAGHTVELQGLRTAVIGALCLAMAGWQSVLLTGYGTAEAVRSASWLPLILVAWHVDDRLVTYYQRRIGLVSPSRPHRRLFVLAVIALIYVGLRIWELVADTQVAVSALFLAGVQLHIALVSGDRYRRHYLLGAAAWSALSFTPMLTLPADVRGILWLVAAGTTMTFLGWRDHLVLMRAVTQPEPSCHA